MFSMIMGSFDGFKGMLFGFGPMAAPSPVEDAGAKPLEAGENQEKKPYGYDAERPTRGTRLVERMDGDGDGGLSWNELGETRRGRRIAGNFDKIDNDGDGKLSAQELDSFRPSRGTRLVERMDGDGDGGLSWNELGETRRGRRIAAQFDRIDNDSDGKLTAMELDSFHKARRHGGMPPQQVEPAETQPAAADPGAAEEAVPAAEAQQPALATPAAPSAAPAAVPAPAPAGMPQQGFFFAMPAGGTSAQQASSSYGFVLALFQ